MKVPRILTAAALAVAAMLALAAGARAGSYHVYGCRTPSGEVAPADGWSGALAPGGAFDDYAVDTCPNGGALVAALGDKTTHLANVDRATWAFAAPAPEQVIGATVWRAGYLHGAGGEKASYQFWLAGSAATNVFDECIFTAGCQLQGNVGQTLSAANQLGVPTANLGSHLYVNVSCGAGVSGSECQGGFTDPNGYAAVVYLYASDITLEQTAGPMATAVAGELASAPAVAGTSDVAFTASDPGAGVYAADFIVDGQLVQRTVLDDNGGRCRNVGQAGDGLPAFLYVQPCPSSLSTDVGLDTTRLANGAHHLVVEVADAAGNLAPVLDRNIIVANPTPSGGAGVGAGAAQQGPANGTPASAQASMTLAWRGARGARLVSGFGRAQTVLGRLTGPGGVPIAGARIDVVATPSSAGAGAVTMAAPHTGADGRFTLRLPAGVSSRTLAFAYRTHLGDPLPAVSRTLTLTVRAGLRLAIGPRIASVGRRIYFRGRLLGGSVPSSGKLLVMEARAAGGAWIKFNVVRSDRVGRYHATYRFRFPGPASYRFRVVSEAESDYPFAAGSSNVVSVREL